MFQGSLRGFQVPSDYFSVVLHGVSGVLIIIFKVTVYFFVFKLHFIAFHFVSEVNLDTTLFCMQRFESSLRDGFISSPLSLT